MYVSNFYQYPQSSRFNNQPLRDSATPFSPSRGASSSDILTAYTSTSSSISLPTPLHKALQGLLSPLPPPGQGVKTVWRDLDLDFGGGRDGNEKEARDELERIRDGVGSMLEGYGWDGEEVKEGYEL